MISAALGFAIGLFCGIFIRCIEAWTVVRGEEDEDNE